MKRLVLSFMMIVLVCTLVGGATLALFTAEATVADNSVTAASLDLTVDRDNGDTVPGPMFYSDENLGLYPTELWYPGYSAHRVMQIENTGSVNAVLDTVRANLQSGSRYFADKLEAKITTDPDGNDVVAAGTLGQFIDGDQAFSPSAISCDVGDLISLHFWVTLPSDADDTYQNQSVVLDFTVHGVQKP